MPTTLSIPQYTSLYLTRFANKSIPIAQQVFRDEFIQAVEQHIGVQGSVSELWSAVQSNFSTAYTDITNRRAGHLLFWSDGTGEGVGIVLPDTSKMRVLDPTATMALPTVGVAGKSFLGGVDVGEIGKKTSVSNNCDPNNSVLRIGVNIEDDKGFKLNESDTDLQRNSTSSDIVLPQGTQVIKFLPHSTNQDYIKVFLWFQGAYREGYIHKDAFEYPIIENNQYEVQVFMNDLEHTLERLYRVKDEVNTINSSVCDNMGIFTYIQKIEAFKGNIENDLIELSSAKLSQALESHSSRIEGVNNLVTVLQNTKNDIFNIADRILDATTNVALSESIIVWSVDENWLLSNTSLFNNSTRSNGLLSMPLRSGQILNDSKKNELLNIQSELTASGMLSNTVEYQFITSINVSISKGIARISYPDYKNIGNFSGGVGVNCSFGKIKVNPLFPIALHEINNACGFVLPNVSKIAKLFCFDTHTSTNEQYCEIWEDMSSSPLFRYNNLGLHDRISLIGKIYQCHNILNGAALCHILSLIESL